MGEVGGARRAGGEVAEPGREQCQPEVEDLGAPAATRPFRLVADLPGRAPDAGRLFLLERLAGGLLDRGARVLGRLQQRSPRGGGALAVDRRGGAALRLGPQLAALGVEQRAGEVKVPRGEAGGGGDLRRVAGAGQLRLDGLDRERSEVDRLTARDDGLEQRRRLGAEQDQVDEIGRLLERLQQRVLALVAHRLGGLEDEDPAAALERSVGGRADHPLADLLDQVLGAARCQPDEVGVGRGIEQRPAAGIVGVGGPGGEDLSRERPRRGPLAGAWWAAEEVGMAGAG